ncbi:MAG: prepilin peptidase [Candidatus Niyogibacteria bacterium]|nr:MAG: prepilin peptidase [Candidatus Niyogibacteria bacterium]
MENAFIFILGLFFGSFANVLVYRLNTGEPIMFSRSRCFSCGQNLKWFELIPVFSFLFLKGRCRVCGSKISWQYPLVELASGFLFLILYVYIPSGPSPTWTSWAIAALFFWLLFVISVYDLRHKIIPNNLVYLSTAAVALFLIIGNLDFIENWKLLIEHFAAGIGLFAFFGGLWFISRGRWMGFGDAKMAFALGLFLGWPETLAAFFFSFWIGAFFGLILAFYNYKLKAKSYKLLSGTQVPFAPFIFLGGLAAYLWADAIIFWYLSLLG